MPSEVCTSSIGRTLALAAQIGALLIAMFCFAIVAWCLYDIAYAARSPNDWGDPANTDVLLAAIINLPGWLIALPLAVFVKPRRRRLLTVTLLLAAAEVLLLTQLPNAFRANTERHQKSAGEMVKSLERH